MISARQSLLLVSFIALTALVVIGILISCFTPQTSNFDADTVQIVLNKNKLTLEIADTSLSRAKGLSDRLHMNPDRGMLFVFDRTDIYPFWMNGMHFPLDIIWINKNTVVEIATNVQPPLSSQDQPVTVVPHVMTDRVIELNAGLAEVYGIEVGTVLKGIDL